MGHLKKMSLRQRSKFLSFSYKRKLEEMRGHYYPYWNDGKYNDWEIGKTTTSESQAKEWRDEMKLVHKKVKIICGYEQVVQRIKHYTIIYK